MEAKIAIASEVTDDYAAKMIDTFYLENMRRLHKVKTQVDAALLPPTPKRLRNAPHVPVRTEPKISRNSICNCGSGKKYKHCCIK